MHKNEISKGKFSICFFFHVKPTNFPILINHTRVSDVSRQKYLEKLISKENLKKGKKKGISIYFLYFPVSGKYSICSYNNIFHIFLLLIHSLYLLLHSISPHFYPTLILHFTFVPTNKSLTIKRLFIVISSFKLIIFGIIPIPIDRSIRRKGKGKERVARVTQEMYDFAPACRQFLCTHRDLRTCYRRAEKKVLGTRQL